MKEIMQESAIRVIENLDNRCAELKQGVQQSQKLYESALKEIEQLKTGLYYAKKFAELVECWGRTDCELYKHELKASADLQLERIAEAIDGMKWKSLET